MKAVRFHGARDIRVEDVAEPSGRLGPDDVLIAPAVTGICGTDLHEYVAGPIVTPATPHPYTGARNPQILGHEVSARVLAVGDAVGHVSQGDRISVQPLVSPRDDYYGRRGLFHLSPSLGCVGLSWAWGGMGERAVIKSYNAQPVPDALTDDQAAMIEPAAVALYGVDRGRVAAGSSVLVSGAGPIGALTVLGAKAAGASTIIVSEPNPNRRRIIAEIAPYAVPVDPGSGELATMVGRHDRGRRRRGRGDRMRRARGFAQCLRRSRPAAGQGGSGRASHAERRRGCDALGAEGHHRRGHLVLSDTDMAAHRADGGRGGISRSRRSSPHGSMPRTSSIRGSRRFSTLRANS